MKKHRLLDCVLAVVILSTSACTSTPVTNYVAETHEQDNRLIVYADGRMEFKSRFVNEEDVVIYPDGRGGERAAIKVRVPIHPDFYRDSIVVVRIVKKHAETIGQRDVVMTNNIN